MAEVHLVFKIRVIRVIIVPIKSDDELSNL